MSEGSPKLKRHRALASEFVSNDANMQDAVAKTVARLQEEGY